MPLFERAYQEGKSPRTAAQLGLCLQALGRFVEAERLLTESLAAERDDWVRKNRAALQDALVAVKARIGFLIIEGSPEGSEVFINGRAVGRLPLPAALRFDAGTVDIELRHPGFRTQPRTIIVDGASTRRIFVQLDRLSDTSASAPTTSSASLLNVSGTAATETPALAAGSADGDGGGTPKRPLTRRPWFWVAIGAVVAGAVVTTVLLTRSSGNPRLDGSTTLGR